MTMILERVEAALRGSGRLLIPALLIIGLAAAAGQHARAGAAAPAPLADLDVSVVESRDPALVETDMTYRISVANRGPRRAVRVTLTATLVGAAQISGRPATTAGVCSTPSPLRLVCSLGTMPRGRRATVSAAVDLTATGALSVSARVVSRTTDRRPRNNRAAATTRVLALHSVQGRGVRSTFGDAGRPTVTTEIDARRDPTSESSGEGTFAVRYAAISASPARGSDLRGRVVCLNVDRNRAMVGGVVESSNSASYPPGTAVRFSVTDNGGAGATPDTQVGFLGGDITPTCALDPTDELPLIEGDFVVRDGEP